MISVNLTVEQLESIHCALFFMAQYHEDDRYGDEESPDSAQAAAEDQQIRLTALDVVEETLGKVLELVPAADLLPGKFYLLDRSELHCGGLERVFAGPFDTQEECRAERIGLHDGRHIVTLYVPNDKLQA